MSDAPVLFDTRPARGGRQIGYATLNAEKTLNSLSLPMIDLLTTQLGEWRSDDNIVAIVIRGAGERAFSAGGDIQDLYRSMVQHPGGPNPYAESFFEREYRLDYLMHTYPKPIIALAHGIVMGGGLGVMAAASHRVGTEQSRIAMPEITIGLFPDAGATWFLAHMPEHLAFFAAWTGCHMNALDGRKVGLIDAVIRAGDRDALCEALSEADWTTDNAANHKVASKVIKRMQAADADMPPSELEAREDTIRELVSLSFEANDPAATFGHRLAAIAGNDKWLQRAAQAFGGGSPTTAQVIIEQIHRARGLTLKETFMLELVIAIQCSRHPDFAEGIRALLIDRDNSPQWKYPDVEAVPHHWIEEHFESPFDGENPLTDLEE